MLKESDWKLFRRKLPEWQERHMQNLLGEYAGIIASAGPASTRFWKLKERLQKDVRHVGVCANIKRSTMLHNLLAMFGEQAITLEDLDGFSDDLRRQVAIFGEGKMP